MMIEELSHEELLKVTRQAVERSAKLEAQLKAYAAADQHELRAAQDEAMEATTKLKFAQIALKRLRAELAKKDQKPTLPYHWLGQSAEDAR